MLQVTSLEIFGNESQNLRNYYFKIRSQLKFESGTDHILIINMTHMHEVRGMLIWDLVPVVTADFFSPIK